MAKAIRGAVTACCKRAGFIFRAPSFCSGKILYSETGFPPPDKNSNNPLAVEPETENDIVHGNYFAGSFMIPVRLKRRL